MDDELGARDGGEQLGGQGGQDPVVAGGVIDQDGDQALGHQLRIAGGATQMAQNGPELFGVGSGFEIVAMGNAP